MLKPMGQDFRGGHILWPEISPAFPTLAPLRNARSDGLGFDQKLDTCFLLQRIDDSEKVICIGITMWRQHAMQTLTRLPEDMSLAQRYVFVPQKQRDKSRKGCIYAILGQRCSEMTQSFESMQAGIRRERSSWLPMMGKIVSSASISLLIVRPCPGWSAGSRSAISSSVTRGDSRSRSRCHCRMI
jgi:hypothetical protein